MLRINLEHVITDPGIATIQDMDNPTEYENRRLTNHTLFDIHINRLRILQIRNRCNDIVFTYLHCRYFTDALPTKQPNMVIVS